MEQIAIIADPRGTETGTNCPQQIFRSVFKALSEETHPKS